MRGRAIRYRCASNMIILDIDFYEDEIAILYIFVK